MDCFARHLHSATVLRNDACNKKVKRHNSIENVYNEYVNKALDYMTRGSL